jgi:hypothetical protein
MTGESTCARGAWGRGGVGVRHRTVICGIVFQHTRTHGETQTTGGSETDGAKRGKLLQKTWRVCIHTQKGTAGTQERGPDRDLRGEVGAVLLQP